MQTRITKKSIYLGFVKIKTKGMFIVLIFFSIAVVIEWFNRKYLCVEKNKTKKETGKYIAHRCICIHYTVQV